MTDMHPPVAQNVFILMQFWGKIDQIIGWRSPLGWHSLLWEILDLLTDDQTIRFAGSFRASLAAVTGVKP